MRSLALLILFGPLFAVPDAHAASRESQERAAKKACLLGDTAKGVEILTDLYVDTNNPIYIFNQGRCYEQNSRYEQAIGLFREFLRKAQSTGRSNQSDIESAEKHIADCQALLEKKSNATASPPPIEPGPLTPSMSESPKPEAAPVQVAQQEPVNSIRQSPPPGTSGSGSGLRIAGVSVMAAGGAALVAGVVLNAKANNMIGDLQHRYDPSTYSSSKDYKTLSLVSYGVAVACIGSGAVLYTLGWRAGHQVQVALVPTLTPGGAGAGLAGAF